MERRKFIQASVAGAVAAPAIVKAQAAAKWKMQSMWSSAELTYKAFEDLCAHINKLCAGKLEITPFAAGAGCSANMSPPGNEMLRCRATRSTNERATTSSIVLDALFSSMP